MFNFPGNAAFALQGNKAYIITTYRQNAPARRDVFQLFYAQKIMTDKFWDCQNVDDFSPLLKNFFFDFEFFA